MPESNQPGRKDPRQSELATMSPGQLITELALRRYEPPLRDVAEREKRAMSELGILILFLDFDSEFLSGGILGFVENSTGFYMDQTIEMFHRIKAHETEAVMRGIKRIMDRYRVTTEGLRADLSSCGEYSISSFTERHGTQMNPIVDEFKHVPGKLYAEPGSTEDAYGLITLFVADHLGTIVAQVER